MVPRALYYYQVYGYRHEQGGGTKILVCDKPEIEVLGGGTYRRDLSAPVILAHDINAFKIYLY